MKKRLSMVFAAILATAVALGSSPVKVNAQENDRDQDFHHQFYGFVPGSIVLSGTVYVGNANTVTPGEVLPYGCLNTGPVTNPNPATVNVPLLPADQTASTTTTAATVSCGYASDNGEAPNLNDNHNVWNNANTDSNFGVSSPIVLWDLSTDGAFLGALHVPSNEIVTSFSSKSELALNRSADGRSLTFMGYRGGPGCPVLTLDPTTNILTQGTNVGPISPTARTCWMFLPRTRPASVIRPIPRSRATPAHPIRRLTTAPLPKWTPGATSSTPMETLIAATTPAVWSRQIIGSITRLETTTTRGCRRSRCRSRSWASISRTRPGLNSFFRAQPVVS